MTRVEYIRQLEFSLSGKLPKREISEILRDYSEYFEAGKSEGKSEEEIAVSLGIPSAAAAQILLEIEEQSGYQRKTIRPEPERAKKSPFWEGWLEWLKTLFERLSEFFSGLFGGIKPGPQPGKAPAAPPAEPPAAAGQPQYAYSPPPEPPKQKKPFQPAPPKKREGKAGRTLASILLTILLIPVIGFALFCGVSLLALLCIGVVSLIIFLCCLFLLFLAAAFAGSIGFSVVGGLGMPFSFTLLFVVGLIACLAGGVLTICILCYLCKGLIWLIRSCFGSVRLANKGQSSAGRAQAADVYRNGWDAPTPPASPAAEASPFEGPGYAPASPYEEISHGILEDQPVPKPHLQFGNEQPEDNPAQDAEENREENGHA